MATKSQLRKEFLVQRRALPPEEVEQRSRAIAELTYNQILSGWADKPTAVATDIGLSAQPDSIRLYISTFLPIRHQNEVNTWPLIHRIWAEHPEIQLAAPVAHTDTRALTHYPLAPETSLIKNRWGIPEPLPTTRCRPVGPLLPTDFDLILVPLLIFDKQGHRVGYGGGYYDRFLDQCRPDCLKIGLSLFEPIEQIDDVEETDIRLDVCLTPTSVYRFG